MSIDAIKSKLAELQLSIAGIKYAHEKMPNSVNPTDCPMFVNLVGDATYNKTGDSGQWRVGIEKRRYPMRLFYGPTMQGENGELEDVALALIPLVRDLFDGLTNLDGVDGILETQFEGDNGLSRTTANGIEYLCTDFTMVVHETYKSRLK